MINLEKFKAHKTLDGLKKEIENHKKELRALPEKEKKYTKSVLLQMLKSLEKKEKDK